MLTLLLGIIGALAVTCAALVAGILALLGEIGR